MINKNLITDFTSAIKEAVKDSSGSYDTTAEVLRVDEDGCWVHIPGGVDETPVEHSIQANPGDTVQVRVANGRAWITGNNSAPPTDDTTAIYARTVAVEAGTAAAEAYETAEEAITEATTAAAAAASAKTSADEAAAAASAAQTSADEAATAAATAEEHAQAAIADAATAQGAAESANTSANSALTQLSIVEDVVDVLTWISDHGTYAKTSDTDIVPGKYYFTRSGSSGNYTYTVVPNPVKSSLSSYYELSGVDEAVSNYIASHLALTDQGLWLVNDNNGWKILIKNTGIEIYNASGTKIVEYGSSITFNSSTPFSMGSSSAGITFDGSAITINGANVTFTNGNTIADYAETDDIPDTSGLLTSVTTKDQYYLSTSASSATGGSWADTVPTWSSGKYLWTRVATTKTNANGSTTTYSTAVYDRALTTALSTASDASTTANAAAPKSDAVARTQRIYYRKTSSGAPAKNTTWLTTSGDGYGNWSLNIPQLTKNNTKYPYLYTAIQTQTVAQQAAGSTCSCSTVLIDDSNTIIDGGNIITGSVTANQIDATNLHVSAANVDGTLTIGQLPSTVAETSDIPTAVSELTNDANYVNATTAQGYASSAQSAAEATASADATAKANAAQAAAEATAAADATAKANDAAKVATNFITTISGGGIKVHDAGDTSNYSKIDSTGMEVYQNGTKVASFGTETSISTTTGTELAHFGYASGAAKTGTAVAPYYTVGERVANSSVGNYSMAEGYYVTASGAYSHAEGNGTSASATYAHAEGVDSKAQNSAAHAEGRDTQASGEYSHAEGDSTVASNTGAHSEGVNSVASGNYAHAEGADSVASAQESHAQNTGTIAASDSQTAIGKYNKSDSADKYAFIIGNGTSASNRSNAFAVQWDGTIESPTIGTFLTASNSAAVSIPTGTSTEITHIDLTAGVWVLLGKVRFSTNTSGVRRINLSPNSGATDINVQAWPVQGSSSTTDMQVMWLTKLTANTTYYLNAYQNSGNTLTCASGIGYIRAVRIA